ncbi:MAG TPA: hypothetical protein VM121_01140 [Acidimicrobiales bacterium]|nr:hypothetical protein [Acidimicrobiales bacterium]
MLVRRPVLMATIVLALASGCSSDNDDKASTGMVTSSVTSAPGPGATSLPPSTQASTGATNLSKGPPYDRVNGPSGSGCTPASPDKLTPGWWAGRIKNVQGNTTFDFDLVCWFAGQAAIKAGGEDDAGPVEDDYYVRDADSKLLLLGFSSANTPATCVGDANEPFQCTVSEVLALYASGQLSGTINGKQVTAFSTVWLHFSGDAPDYLYMQFTP